MKIKDVVLYFLFLAILSLVANSFVLVKINPLWLFAVIPLYFLVVFCCGRRREKSRKSLKSCFYGMYLLSVFLGSTVVSVGYHIFLAVKTVPTEGWSTFLWSAVYCTVFEAIVFWIGIICVYLTSIQLGIKIRVVGALCGMIPIANLICLAIIIKTTYREVEFETKFDYIQKTRKNQNFCRTKYPILLVHGVFFRDSKILNYWGRIPKALETNGAEIYYGNHQSASSVADSAKELTERIRAIVEKTGCEKVNIIAHSKGGLDCRYAMAFLGASKYVASLTTINSPHRGCKFADFILEKLPEAAKNKLAETYNSALKRIGDDNPDFMAAVNDLTASVCVERDREMPLPEGVFCQSVGSKLNKAKNGKFPLNFTYRLAKYFDGANDGLVGEDSFEWGENYIFLETSGKRGISHGDVIDLNRENIKDFDVRSFYIKLVNDLKEKGL